MKQGQISGGKS
jgi:hypothetical protein